MTRDQLHAAIDAALGRGIQVSVNVHSAPAAAMFAWLQDGTLDAIERGASSNPPTGRGRLEAGDTTGRADLVVFMLEGTVPGYSAGEPELEPKPDDDDGRDDTGRPLAVDELRDGWTLCASTQVQRGRLGLFYGSRVSTGSRSLVGSVESVEQARELYPEAFKGGPDDA